MVLANFKSVDGDIFSSSTEAVVITVNCVGAMGAGIALEARYRWPEINDRYEKACELRQVSVGELIWEKTQSKWVILFPTKKHYSMPSEMTYISQGLVALAREIKSKAISSIALPHLGCSHGGLMWSEVKPMIESNLMDISDLDVELWDFHTKFIDPAFIRFRNSILCMNSQEATKWLQTDKGLESRIRKVLLNSQSTNFSSFRDEQGLGEKTIQLIYRVGLDPNWPAAPEQLPL